MGGVITQGIFCCCRQICYECTPKIQHGCVWFDCFQTISWFFCWVEGNGPKSFLLPALKLTDGRAPKRNGSSPIATIFWGALAVRFTECRVTFHRLVKVKNRFPSQKWTDCLLCEPAFRQPLAKTNIQENTSPRVSHRNWAMKFAFLKQKNTGDTRGQQKYPTTCLRLACSVVGKNDKTIPQMLVKNADSPS